MKGKKCIKYLILCIICLLSLSHCLDANALTITQNAEPTGNSWSFTSSTYQYTDNNGQSWTNSNIGNITLQISTPVNSRKFLHGIRPSTKINVQEGYYYQTNLVTRWTYSNAENAHNLNLIYNHFTSSDFDVISWTPSQCVAQYQLLDSYPTNSSNNSLGEDPVVYVCNDEIVLRAKTTGNVYFQLGTGQDLLMSAIIPFQCAIVINDVIELNPTDPATEMNEKDNQDREDIEQQSSSTEQSADTASEDVGGATTNIIGAINGFATAVTNIQAGTCILPEISAYGMNLGRLNLCTYSPPAWVQGLTSTILSLITLKMAISIFYRIMGLLDGVLGGKK